MKEPNYLEAILKRKSIRKYEQTPLKSEVLDEISKHIKILKAINEDIKVEINLLFQKDINTLMAAKAPHYIAFFSEAKENYLTNAGFMLQQMDLFLSAKGLGSCWLGMAKPAKSLLNNSNLEFVVLLAFGKPAEPLYRNSLSDFKRHTLDKITHIPGAENLLEPVRLAPSAVNSQPWFFTGSTSLLHCYCSKSNFLRRVNKIDMGIALLHLRVSCKYLGKNIQFISNAEAEQNSPNGYYYITSAAIE